MQNLFQIVNLLEDKISKLLSKYTDLQQENKILLLKKGEFEEQLNERHQQIIDLEKKYESLRVANAMVGSKEDKHITKLKINTLIRQIDKCIVQLSD
ncbi:MAG: hypothetical protein L3J34_05200 [Flavobacteriaceae bacterium]|nr:hypothetical protein [Flavobacteriaceae bacterium]